MRTIDLVVLGDRAGGTTRAYLAYLNAAGMRPRELWLLDFVAADDRVHTLRRVPLLGARLANLAHRRLPRSAYEPPPPFRDLCAQLQERVQRPVDFVGEFPFAAFAQNTREMVAEDFDDPWLQALIRRHRKHAFLYTSGGIVPPAVLRTPGVKMLHVHPGLVPEVRGSDCFLWSCWTRGRPGASAFYMAPGIDEGPVLGRKEFDLPDLGFLQPWLTEEHEDTVYRALAHALDPHLRAWLLVEIIAARRDGDLRALAARPQAKATRPAFLWIHPQVRLHMLRHVVARSATRPGAVLEAAA